MVPKANTLKLFCLKYFLGDKATIYPKLKNINAIV